MSMRAGATPVPIPNTMVKTRAADGTVLETVWESRWTPDFVFINPYLENYTLKSKNNNEKTTRTESLRQ